ncbi:probable ATP-dependent RNA helicase Dbp45A [Choristoneura fumiferana]|uniref:probable ATP-dependent RNA helicase Dbp45A n=1 Tax=Choristoneura fumiferana TaxID=7141 RepID=UPI003D15B482
MCSALELPSVEYLLAQPSTSGAQCKTDNTTGVLPRNSKLETSPATKVERSSSRELIMNDNEGKEFAALGVKKWLIKQLFSLGIKSPTPIQKGCIQQILAGDDCIGAAKTGSGKTFAFALPILQNLSEDPYGIFALVLTPTHELAYQIADQFSILGQPLSLRVCIVTGGSDQLEESLKLAKRPHIVVAMPGRLADHITGCDTFSLKKIKYLVLDEADRLFSESFSDDLETIFNVLPAKRQNLLFSATISEEVRDSKILPLNKDRLLIWKETDTQLTVSTLDQRYAVCPAYARDVYLVQALRKYRETTPSSHVLVFTDTKKECQVLSMMLNAIGMDNVCLHGYMRQKERVAALAQFRSNLKCTLVATNVAARGLDIPSVHLVLNHKLPLEPTEYIHRLVYGTVQAPVMPIFRVPEPKWQKRNPYSFAMSVCLSVRGFAQALSMLESCNFARIYR